MPKERDGNAAMRRMAGVIAAIVLAVAPAYGSQIFTAELIPINDSGVSGQAQLTLNEDALTVSIQATGLEPGRTHPQHIHGLLSNGTPIDSTIPTIANDTDNDGFVEVAEGASSYGPVIVSLTSPPGGALADFPTAPDGTIAFEQTYNLNDTSTFATGFSRSSLLPLDFREIVLHGMTVEGNSGNGTPGEVDGTAGYKALLPVATGVIESQQAQVIPEPGTVLLTGLGLIGSFAYLRLRRRP